MSAIVKKIPHFARLFLSIHTVDSENDGMVTTTAWSDGLAKQLDDFGWILGSVGSSVARLCVASSNPRGLQLSCANDTFFENLHLIEG